MTEPSCGNPAFEQDALMSRRPKYDRTKTCIRCKSATGNVVLRHNVYCKPCFGPMVATKFRKTLGPHVNSDAESTVRRKTLKASGALLVGFSGGLGSTVLLDLVSKSYFPKAGNDGGKKGGKKKSQGDEGGEDPTMSKTANSETVEKKIITSGGAELRDRHVERRGGKAHPRNARVWSEGAVCYVEVSNAFPGTRDRMEEMRELLVREYDQLEFVGRRVEDAFDPLWWESIGGEPTRRWFGVDLSNEYLKLSDFSATSNLSPTARLQKYLSLLPTTTAVLSATQDFVRLILLYTAKARQSSHLLLGTSLTGLSISLISSIAQGGGFNVKGEAYEEWEPQNGENQGQCKTEENGKERAVGSHADDTKHPLRVVNPLRDVSAKECAIWAWWNGLKIPGKEKYQEGKPGVGAITYKFITGLEKDFPSTVSAIAKTCAKLEPKGVSEALCILCQRPAQPQIQEWKNRISIWTFTDPSIIPPPHVSRQHVLEKETELYGGNRSTSMGLTPLLCYACHTTLTSRSSRGIVAKPNDLTGFPVWVEERLERSAEAVDTKEAGGEKRKVEAEEEDNGIFVGKRKVEEEEMKESLKEFLLEE